MKKLKVLNLYAGIGGNRKLWEDVEVTAVEIDNKRAKIYQEYFPNDCVIVDDAHKYLLDHFEDEWDFIWSSPPCPSHSDIRRCGVRKGQYSALYADMSLYQEIILLKHFAPLDTKWVVENVKPYYKLLIPAFEVERHLFWSNFLIRDKIGTNDRKHDLIVGSKEVYGFNIKNKDCDDKRATLRNLVNPYLGLHILNCAKEKQQHELF